MMSRRRYWIVSIALLIGLLASIAVVFILTEQDPQETSSLSNAVLYVLYLLARPFKSEWSYSDYIWSSWLVRKLAHTVEFFVIGLFTAAVSIVWSRRDDRRRSFRSAFGLSVAASLFDQSHKLFVPGREFDVVDLAFDALGYYSAIRLVFAHVKKTKKP